jgi:ABC-type phosphate/phosphonate transport system substrate-binding protein
MDSIAALPMYDWPECRSTNDLLWAKIREKISAAGLPAPKRLARCNADMPPVPGGIRDESGQLIAPDPAELPPDEFDLFVLWRHPGLVFAQTCWGPMQAGLAEHVEVLGQPDYSNYKGGEKELYRSAIVMRGDSSIEISPESLPVLPIEMMRGKRFAFNDQQSMSGILALKQDMVRTGAIPGEDHFGSFWSERVQTGSHRDSIAAVASGLADVAAIDCKTWHMALEHEPASRALAVVGWTAPRPGLPYIRSKRFAAAVNS